MLSKACAAIAIFAVLVLNAVPIHAEEKPEKARRELERIQEQLKGAKKKAAAAGKKERSVLSDIENIDQSLSRKRAEVRRLEAQLGEVSREIGSTGSQMEDKRSMAAEREGDLAGRLRAMYKTDRAGGTWALLVSGEYGSMLKRYKYLSVVSMRDKAMVDRYEGDLEELSRYRDKLKGQRQSYDRLKGARDSEARQVQGQEEEKKKLLASVRKQKDTYEAMARELEESSRRMQELIGRLETEKRAKPGPALPSSPAFRGTLDWPVFGRVTSLFGRQKHPDYDMYIFKKGIEIQAPMGTEVRAVAAGEVAFANWFKGLGLVVILRHGGDYYTVYAHLSELMVKQGNKVGRGQVIATLGDSGAPAGPSLYFEVRKGPEAQDPLRWLKKR